MQYMLLIYGDERAWNDAPSAEAGKMSAGFAEFTQGIVKSGHFRAGGRLKPTTSATTVREKQGKLITVDGPFAETKEQLGGYYLIECRDLDEAIAIAKRVPASPSSSVEIRPLFPAPTTPA
jgi:hypothetical protein